MEFLRLVSMICMLPKCHLKSKMIIKKRKQAYINKQTLSHWPIEYSPLWTPRNMDKNKWEDADELTKSLVGGKSLGNSNFII